VELTGFEPRRSDLARGIVIARSTRPLEDDEQRALWKQLGLAGITESDEEEEAARDEGSPEPARRWHAAPWMPPGENEIDAQRIAIEQTARKFDVEAMWFIKVETGIDGVAWMEMMALEAENEDDDDDERDQGAQGTSDVMAEAMFASPAEVLYAAPDAPPTPIEEDEETDEDDDEDALDLEDIGVLESHWRNGPPPLEHSVAFPIERYPEIIDDYDWKSFGVAFKLGGEPLAGEESVVNAFFALWLSVYQDERAEDLEAFQRADVVHDRKHRSALMWVEKFAVPATASDQAHFLLWVIARINDIIPIAWSRFEIIDNAVKSRASGDDGDPFVLAGNPFADRYRRHGEESALAWAVSQSAWTKRELAGMLVEVALDHDPDDPTTAVVAERLLRRALSFDPTSDASGYLSIVLVRQKRLPEAIALARSAPSRDVRLLVVGEMAEHAPAELPSALELLDDETMRALDPEDLSELIGTIARYAHASLGAVLDRLPAEASLVPYLYNASFSVERPQALTILRKVLALPPPARDAGEARTALVMAWNNACIHAHALGDYRLAVELANGGQPYAAENPYIYHSAACAYASVGQIDQALEQVSRAIEHEYEHTEKMETDNDLAPLQSDPRFGALFVDWRARRADLN
jgi:tetratricopeptide (TPR) repeat protein